MTVAPLHVALPQDEFLNGDVVNAFLSELGARHVFSVAPPSEWPKIYGGLDAEISQALTGYLDEATLGRIDAVLARAPERTVDIGYRTVPGKPYLGRHGMLKAELAEAVRERAFARGLRVDISTRVEDTIYGDDWYRFLASCRYTIGIEGGASINDHDGSVRRCVEAHLVSDPEATFDELEAACFPGRDGELELFAISPRHLEACATRTPQILVEGAYNGVLHAGEHYLELRRDLSNLDAVLDVVAADRGDAERIAERAHRDVVASGRYTLAAPGRRRRARARSFAGARPGRRSGALSAARRRRGFAAADPGGDEGCACPRGGGCSARSGLRTTRGRHAGEQRAAATSAACSCSTTGRSRRCSATRRRSSSTCRRSGALPPRRDRAEHPRRDAGGAQAIDRSTR